MLRRALFVRPVWKGGLLVAALALLCGDAACGGGPVFRNQIYEDGVVRYRVGAQTQGFERVALEGNDLAWHDARYGTIGVNSTCKQGDAPARVLLNHLLMGTTERKLRRQESLTLDGRSAQHVIADLVLDGVPVTVDVYLIVRGGCAYDLTLVSAPDNLSRSEPLFDAFVHEFAVLSEG